MRHQQRGRKRVAGSTAALVPVSLPDGVDAAAWALERVARQNPRIRALLAAIRMLEDVRESNYAILHCSPRRLQEIWTQVRRVAESLRTDVAPLFEEPSPIPALESARQAGEFGLGMLDRTVLRELDGYPAQLPRSGSEEVRKLVCVGIGKLLDFLQDTFGNLMAADPRSQHDADYFLSRSFSRDVDEAEWLHEAVLHLEARVLELDARRSEALRQQARLLRAARRVSGEDAWAPTASYLAQLVGDLVPELKHVRGLRGIRLEELDLLSTYAAEIPETCRAVRELRELALEALERLRGGPAEHAAVVHEVCALRLAGLISQLDGHLSDLIAVTPIWRRGVEQRRALLLRERGGLGGAPSES